MLKNLSKREKYLLIVLAVMIVFYVYYRLLLLPILNDIYTSKANINKYNEEINLQITNNVSAKNDKLKLEELKTKIDKALVVFPAEEREPEIAYDVKAISNSCNVTLTAVSFGEAAEYQVKQGPKLSDKVMSVPVTLQFTGEYKNITNFIAKLENDTRMAVAENVILTGGNNSIHGSISLKYLYLTGQNSKDTKYDFNNGAYGKDNLFK